MTRITDKIMLIQFEAFKYQKHGVANMFQSNAREVGVAYRAHLMASLL